MNTESMWIIFIKCVCLISLFLNYSFASDGLELCQANCVSSYRLTGPTRMAETKPHPWKVAQYPTSTSGFCKLGCQLFYAKHPQNETCYKACDKSYRYKISSGYSDIAEEARLECRDGCSIALQICQAGYFCSSGNMTVCPSGRYRESVTDISIVALQFAKECTECPFGRYRPIVKGKSANECNLCPVGKYANKTGGIQVSDCERCPAGKFAEQEGMQLCKCINSDSCDLSIDSDGISRNFFSNDIDFYRESVPFIGRW